MAIVVKISILIALSVISYCIIKDLLKTLKRLRKYENFGLLSTKFENINNKIKWISRSRLIPMTIIIFCLFMLFFNHSNINYGKSIEESNLANNKPPNIKMLYLGKISNFDVGIHYLDMERKENVIDRIKNDINNLNSTFIDKYYVLVGRADKRLLKGQLQNYYGNNSGLAAARANWVKNNIIFFIDASSVEDNKVLILTSGPNNTGIKISKREYEEDRSVEIYIVGVCQ